MDDFITGLEFPVDLVGQQGETKKQCGPRYSKKDLGTKSSETKYFWDKSCRAKKYQETKSPASCHPISAVFLIALARLYCWGVIYIINLSHSHFEKCMLGQFQELQHACGL